MDRVGGGSVSNQSGHIQGQLISDFVEKRPGLSLGHRVDVRIDPARTLWGTVGVEAGQRTVQRARWCSREPDFEHAPVTAAHGTSPTAIDHVVVVLPSHGQLPSERVFPTLP